MKVPYQQVAEVKPQGAPGVFFNLDGDTGGQLVGQALKQAGATLGQAADRMEDTSIKLALINNEAAAKDLDVQFALGVADAREKFLAQTGKNAVDSGPEFRKFLTDYQEEVLKNAPNDAVRRMARNSITTRVVRNIEDSARHVATQTVQYNNASTKARSELLGQEAAREQDDARFVDQFTAAQNEIRSLKDKNGWSDDQTKVELQKQADTIWSQRIKGVSFTDPERATKMLDQHGDNMTEGTRAAVAEEVARDAARVGASRIAEEVVSNTGEGNYEEYERVTFRHESGNKKFPEGDPRAKNPDSTASGLGQITKGTWKQIQKEHPELGLPSFEEGRFDAEWNKKATRAFSMDNKKKLENEGIPANFKNMYMTHFMGRTGGPEFIKAMKADPDQSAAALFRDAAASNQTVFYKTDGTARTLKEVYDLQTKNKSDKLLSDGDATSVVLTPNSTQAEINQMAANARAKAQERFPDRPEVADRAEAAVRQKSASVLAIAKDHQKQNFALVVKGLLGDGKTQPTSLDDLFNSNPAMRDAYYSLDIEQTNKIDRALLNNANRKGADIPMTPERIERIRELRGMAISDREKFNKMVIAGEDIPLSEQKKLMELQMKPPTPSEDLALTSVISKLGTLGVLKAAKLDKRKGEKWDKFVGRLDEELRERAAKGETMDDKAIRELGISIVQEKVVKPGWWGTTIGETKKPGYMLERPVSPTADLPPREITDIIVNKMKSESVSPTPELIKKYYERNKEVLDKMVK